MSSIVLPIELVHQICLFTGKFVLDKENKLKSVLDVREYENINKQLMASLILNHRFNSHDLSFVKQFHIGKIISSLYKKRSDYMTNEQREQAELLHSLNVNKKRHPLLFVKESSIEEVMKPGGEKTFCQKCQYRKLLPDSYPIRRPSKKYSYIRGYINENIYFLRIINTFMGLSARDKCRNVCEGCMIPLSVEKRAIERQQSAIIATSSKKYREHSSAKMAKKKIRSPHLKARR